MSDEAFWDANQRFFTERMGQPCCTLAGIARILTQMPGRFAVVVHGEDGCLDCFPHFEGRSVSHFYGSRVSQLDCAAGRTEAVLESCLAAVLAGQDRPELVFVLSSCLMEMIGSDLEGVCRRAARKHGVPVLALRTSGLKIVSQAEYTDWFYGVLAGLGGSRPRRPAAPGALNIVGLPRLEPGPRRELESLLAAAGARLRCSYPLDAGLDDWRSFAAAAAHAVVDSGLYPSFTARLRKLEAPLIPVPLPVGLAPTLRFFRAIARAFAAVPAMDRALAGPAAEARERMRGFARRFGGLRVAVGLRMANFAGASRLAFDGLGELAAFTELGWKPTLLIQGPPEKKARDYFASRLRRLGCRAPALVFAEPGELEHLLGGGRFDAAFMGDHARDYARAAGVPLIGASSLAPFFGGIARNLAVFAAALDGKGKR
ncbi:MAG: hypothetical protein A2X36_10835 [Elusimicrobia bacterium GWA2_69_24]|nr:MAG: hypothetical protein A2X36_10835 [Elusimicrobia bacterium GWA2_69_24]HBL18471.1 hypothetical protein [Elusimicrobiota bacterium]